MICLIYNVFIKELSFIIKDNILETLNEYEGKGRVLVRDINC